MKVDPTKTHQIKLLKHTSPLIGCRIAPGGEFVFASAQDSSIIRWHLETGKKVEFKGHESWVRGLAFASKPGLLFTGDYTGRVLIWPIKTEKPAPQKTLKAHKGWVRAVAVSGDEKILATCGNDHLVKLWSIADGKLLRTLTGHACHVYNVGFHPDGKHLVSGDLKGIVKVWDLTTGKVTRELDAKVLHKYDKKFRADIGGVRSLAFSPDGKLLACAGITDVTNAFAGVGKPVVVLFDWQTGKPKLLRPKQNFRGAAWGVFLHPEGFVAAVGGGRGGAMWFWQQGQERDYHRIKFKRDARDLALHPDGNRLAVAFQNGTLGVYAMMAKKA